MTLPATTVGMSATSATSKESSGSSFDVSALLTERFDYSTIKIPAEHASLNGMPDSELGWRQIPKERSGYELGLRRGAISVMQSPTLEAMAMQNVLLNKLVDVMLLELVRREQWLDWYRGLYGRMSDDR